MKFIIDNVDCPDKSFFQAQYKNHQVIGYMYETRLDTIDLNGYVVLNDDTIGHIIVKMKPGHKGWTPSGCARDCGDHYIIARYDRFDRVDKKTFTVTRDVEDK